MSTGKVLIALLGGMAAGATLAILFAPDKGSETRKKVNEYTGGLADKLTHMFDSAMTDHTEGGSTTARSAQTGHRKTSYSSQS